MISGSSTFASAAAADRASSAEKANFVNLESMIDNKVRCMVGCDG